MDNPCETQKTVPMTSNSFSLDSSNNNYYCGYKYDDRLDFRKVTKSPQSQKFEHSTLRDGTYIYPAQLKRISNFSNDAANFVIPSLFVTSSTAT